MSIQSCCNNIKAYSSEKSEFSTATSLPFHLDKVRSFMFLRLLYDFIYYKNMSRFVSKTLFNHTYFNKNLKNSR